VWALLVDHNRGDLFSMGAFVVMGGNWAMILWSSWNPMRVLWSISVEEQFYIFCPVAIKELSNLGLGILSLGLVALSDVVLVLLGKSHAIAMASWYSSLVQFQAFGAGLLLCLYLHDKNLKCSAVKRTALLLTSPVLWYTSVAAFHIRTVDTSEHPALNLVLGYSCATLGCVCLLRGMLGIQPKWLPRRAIWLGKISFGLYVYHQLASRLVRMVLEGHLLVSIGLSFALTVAMAAASYRWLERPFLKLKERFEMVEVRVAA
jgi:peptidoglycan/LPS O-acetylase OafA/YrhL